MKLIAFIQMYNEASRGNLVRCLQNVQQWADEICIYDDASTDNSVAIARRFTTHVIEGTANEFHKELSHKQQLLEYALKLKPDWIMWIDCDEILDREATTGGLRALTENAAIDIEAFCFRQLNLWRSQTYARVDSLFGPSRSVSSTVANVPAGWFCRLWRVTPDIHFSIIDGVHRRLYPITIGTVRPAVFHVIHYGFWDYKPMLKKIGAHTWDHATFLRLGPTNWILDERRCECIRVSGDMFPPENIPPDIWPCPQPRPTEPSTTYSELADGDPLSMVAGQDSVELWRERHYDDYHGTYEKIHERNQGSYSKGHDYKRICMFEFGPAGKRLVDLGCGGGPYALDCIANGAEHVYCLEIDQQIIDHASRSFRELEVPEDKYDFMRVPAGVEIAPGSIDIVYCMAVFMHIPLCEVQAYLCWIHRVLADEGEAHLQFHQVDGTTLFRSDGIPEHSYRIPDNSVDAILEEAGLTITDKEYPRDENLEPVWTLYKCKRTAP